MHGSITLQGRRRWRKFQFWKGNIRFASHVQLDCTSVRPPPDQRQDLGAEAGSNTERHTGLRPPPDHGQDLSAEVGPHTEICRGVRPPPDYGQYYNMAEASSHAELHAGVRPPLDNVQ